MAFDLCDGKHASIALVRFIVCLYTHHTSFFDTELVFLRDCYFLLLVVDISLGFDPYADSLKGEKPLECSS